MKKYRRDESKLKEDTMGLVATDGKFWCGRGHDSGRIKEGQNRGNTAVNLPFDETPAPISISGSSTTIPLSIGLPPVPPYSAVNIHLRSASVRRSMGMMLMPV